MVWIGDRAPEAVVHEWFGSLKVASRGFCSSCEMRIGAVEARSLRARGQSHACARARSPIPLAIGRGETVADIVQQRIQSLCISHGQDTLHT